MKENSSSPLPHIYDLKAYHALRWVTIDSTVQPFLVPIKGKIRLLSQTKGYVELDENNLPVFYYDLDDVVFRYEEQK